MPNPFAREFDFDPESYCLQNRNQIVLAGIRLIRAWVMSGRVRQEGRTASFERWDEIVRHPGKDGARSNRWHWRPKKHKTAHRGKTKLYVIGPRAQRLLELWEAHRRTDSPYVFTTRSGRPVSRNHYRASIHATCRRIGIPTWNPNQIRHTRATEVSHKFGAEAEAASLGHTAGVAQRVYVERNLKLAEEVAEKIG
jgi:integrase